MVSSKIQEEMIKAKSTIRMSEKEKKTKTSKHKGFRDSQWRPGCDSNARPFA